VDFLKIMFLHVKYLSFHNFSFALKILLNVNGKATSVAHPLFTLQPLLSLQVKIM